MPTITDVAQTAGVSKNTVSRYLNNRGYMSEKTKAAIQAAIEELHYQPNQIARSLYTSKTSLVGLVIPDVEHPFFSTITARIEDALDTRGYKMILCNTMHSSQKERKYIDMLTANKVDGIIIGSHSVDINYSDINAPIVALDRNLADDIPVVASDHVARGMQVPDDLFIFGYDGTFLAQAVFPPLLTVAQSYDLLARTVVDVLMKRIDGDQLESLSYVIPMGVNVSL